MSAGSDLVEIEPTPSKLYRYMRVCYAEPVITQSLLFFASPRDFNDPFDCQILLSVEATKLAYRSYLQRLSKKGFFGYGYNRHMRRTVISKMDRASFEEAYRRTLKQLSERAGLVCFSETNDDILLWSHYAEKHSGVCLEFNVLQDDLLREKTKKVNYAREYPDLNFFDVANEREAVGELTEDQERDLAAALYLTKSEHWSYEKEWRSVKIAPKSQSFRGQRHISPRALSGVILGCRISSADEKEIRSWVASSSSRPIIYDAKKKEKEFGLEILSRETV
jgi:Protein of unknown function (DUF2971)